MNRLQIVENNNQRVLTTAQLAEAYDTDNKVISNNFNRNKNRYVEGKHYYCLSGTVKRNFINHHQIEDGSNSKEFYLWTEKGALLHAKSLNTDKAWEVYDQLVENYFRVKSQPKSIDIPTDKLRALEVKEMNARVRMSNQFLKLANVDTLSSEYKNILVAKSAEVLVGKPILQLPKSEQKMYTASDIGDMFNVTAQKIGRIANLNGLKTEEYGQYYRDKSPYSNKEVDSFRYNDKAVEKFKELLG